MTVPINGQAEFTATINLSNSTISTTTTVSWEVDGTAGGSSVVGTITPSSVDSEVGIYTAPAVVPNPSTVNITAVVQQTNSSATTPPTITSNTATISVGAGLGLSITPTGATVAAGGSQQFTALLNGLPDSAATWAVTSASGITDNSIIGSIDLTGLYTAPASPPPDGTLTITATDGTNTATAVVSVVYSDLSLNGPYAFSYTGNDQTGFLAAAGSFVADGRGHIVSGVEDVASFLNGVATGVPISGTYSVGNNGRGTANITRGATTEVWRFAVTTGQHAQLTLSEPNATGGGSIDQQSIGALSNSASLITGPYVFSALGADGKNSVAPSTPYAPRGMAGEFTANGAGSILAADGTVLDVNDNGTVSPADTSLYGTYLFDSSNPGTGRGTITLQSTGMPARQFAFYAVNTAVDQGTGNSYITQLHLVEIDGVDAVAGDMFSAPSATALGSGNLAAANYAFTYGGNSSSGAYAAGGIFTSNGSGGATGGVLDTNNAGTTALNTTISGCTSTLDPTERRIDLVCTAGGSTPEFAVYQTSLGSAVMLELDPAAVATGTAYEQCGPSSAGCAAAAPAISANSVALGLIGQGIFHNSPSSYQQDIDGQISLAGGITPGSIDINNFTAAFAGDPISAVSLGAASSLGRGTTAITASNPAATYNLIYYLIDDKTALLFDQDNTFVLRGSFAQQY
ncbi:MAG: beta strand repeat-containing protein [Candidatus Acidiferrales bacterium]